MTKRMLQLAPDLKLPAEDFLESATALIAKRGMGKTGGVKVMLEELSKAKLPFVAFDPIGVLWGLRSSFKGDKPGYDVLVIGGNHADIPIERDAGREVARAIIEGNIPAIIDLKGQSWATYRHFVKDFADTMLAENQDPRLLVFSEAPRLVPQRVMKDTAQTYASMERLVSQGRNVGLGVVLESQRVATVNKDVLTQVDQIIMMGTIAPTDRDSLKKWVEEVGEDPKKLKTFLDGLAKMKPREAWIWSPTLFELFRSFRFRDFTTFHPDRTHLRRMGLLKVRPVEPDMAAAIGRLKGRLAELHEKAQTEDPKRLQKRIRELEAQAAKKGAAVEPIVERVEVPVLSDADRVLLQGAQQAIADVKAELRETWNKFVEESAAVEAVADRVERAAAAKAPRSSPTSTTSRTKTPPKRTAPPAGDVSRPQQAIVDALAWLEGIHVAHAPKHQVGFLAGASPRSSAFTNNLGTLRSGGYIDYPQPGYVTLTDAGRAIADAPAAAPSSQDLWDRIRERLQPARWRILEALIIAHPEDLPKEELAARAEASATSSAFTNNLGALRSLGLIEYPSPGRARASDLLFVGASR